MLDLKIVLAIYFGKPQCYNSFSFFHKNFIFLFTMKTPYTQG